MSFTPNDMPGLPDPFYDRTAIQDLARFFGRREELATIYDLICRQQSVSIVGPFRIGKASLLHMLGKPECQKRAGWDLSSFAFIFLDFADYQHVQMTQDGFFQDACKKVIAVCQQQVNDFEFSAEDWPTRFRYLLQHISGKGLYPVLLMNAFDKVTRNEVFDLKFFSFLRSLALRNIVCYVTASIKPLSKVCHQYIKTSPFFDVFKECVLGPLKMEEAHDLIVSPAQDTPYAFTSREVEWTIEQAGRNPFLLQVTCSAVFHEKSRQNVKELDSASLEQVGEQVYCYLQSLFDSIWMSLGDESADTSEPGTLSNEQRLLKDEARRGSSPTRMRQSPALSESLLMRRCISERFNTGEPEISFDDVKDALGHLDNVEALGNTPLAETYYVRSRYENAKNGPPVKKGKIVLSFLNEAHRLMSPGGTRTDSAPEWRSYNILYYHYFRYHLNNEQTLARLGLRNRRTFYRKQHEAIEQLLEKVRALEIDALHGNS